MKHPIIFILLALVQACRLPVTGVYKRTHKAPFAGEVYQIELKTDSTFAYDISGHMFGGLFKGTWQVKEDTLLLTYNLPPVKKHELIEKNIVGQIGKKLVIGSHTDSTILLIVRVSINDQSHFQFSNMKGEVYLPDSIKLKKFEISEDISFEIKDSTANWFKVLLATPKPVIYGILYKKMLIKRRYLVPPGYEKEKYYRTKKK